MESNVKSYSWKSCVALSVIEGSAYEDGSDRVLRMAYFIDNMMSSFCQKTMSEYPFQLVGRIGLPSATHKEWLLVRLPKVFLGSLHNSWRHIPHHEYIPHRSINENRDEPSILIENEGSLEV